MQIYLVGGAVRNKLLGIAEKDHDWVVVGATPEDMLVQGYQAVGKDFPVFLHPDTKDEYALARTERKSGKGYTGFICHAAPDVTLEQDLLRRDLTINAIAESDSGELIDPYNGKDDLKQRILRHVSPAFVEDPLRVLRVARFAAQLADFKFTVADETMQLMREIVRSGELENLTAERVWQELERVLNCSRPRIFFEVLRACGALQVIFPELDAMFGVPNPPKYHPEIDSGVHNLMVLDQASLLSDNPVERFAALLHDLGKAVTPIEHWPSHPGHERHGLPIIKVFCQRLRVPKKYQHLACLVGEYHGHCHKAMELRASTIVKLLEKLDAFRRPDTFKSFLLVSEADARGCLGLENRDYPQRDRLMQAFIAAGTVDVQEIIAKGYTGEQIKQRLHQVRVSAVKSALNIH